MAIRLCGILVVSKPRLRLIGGEFVPADETRLQRAHRRHGRPLGRVWQRGEGVSYFTAERVAQLAHDNEQRRKNRK